MKFLNYLQEEYLDRYADWEIFVNPTPKELRSFSSVRFIADNPSKKFYVSYSLVYHEYLFNYLKRKNLIESGIDSFMGMGPIKNSLIEFEDFSYDWGEPKDMNKYRWTMKYFTKESQEKLWT
jgi:hypothetical protein